MNDSSQPLGHPGHPGWVRATHWIATASFAALVLSGVVILMSHPRLYWGEAGNDLTPAWLELPISKNYQHGGWSPGVPFFAGTGSPVSASRTFAIFNQNSWGRSLHFLASWFLIGAGSAYLLWGWGTGHFRRRMIPGVSELSWAAFGEEIKDHLRLRVRKSANGLQYGLLQKCTYFGVVFLLMPLTALSGFAMSPMITSEYPMLATVFGGMQSARSIHFLVFVLLLLFLAVHVIMVVRTGFKRHMKAMTIGK